MRNILVAMLYLSLCGCARLARVELTADADGFARRQHIAQVRCRAIKTHPHFRLRDKYLPPFKAAAELRMEATFEVLRWERGAMGTDLLSIENAAIVHNNVDWFLTTNSLYWLGFDEVVNRSLAGTITIRRALK